MTSPASAAPLVRSPTPVERLIRRPGPFDFFQAVSLLENAARRENAALHKDAALRWDEVGKGLDPEREAVRFRSSLSLGFAETDITRVELRGSPLSPGFGAANLTGDEVRGASLSLGFAKALADRQRKPRDKRKDPPHAFSMEVSFFGLAGAHGALPLPFAELVARRDHLERHLRDGSRHEAAMRELLDIFTHRLLALYYRAGKRARPTLGAAAPQESALLGQVASVMGLGTPTLLKMAAATHRPALHTAGIAAREARSTAAIEVALTHALGLPRSVPVHAPGLARSVPVPVPVRVIPFTGEWVSIEPSDRTTVGRAGRNHRLGRTAILGSRLYDPSSGMRVEVGSPQTPLSYRDFRSLMPGGDRFSTLCQMKRFLVGGSIELSLRCTYVAADAARACLWSPGSSGPDLLGLTAVLGRRRRPQPPASTPPRTRTVTVRAEVVRRFEETERRAASASAPPRRRP